MELRRRRVGRRSGVRSRPVSAVAITVLGCVGVLVLDVLASLASRLTPARYGWFAPGSLIAYVLTGYFAGAAAGTVLAGAAAGAAVAAVEATLGWRVARRLGVDDDEAVTEQIELVTATIVTVVGAVLGAIAAALA